MATGWLGLVLSLLKLFASLSQWAQETQLVGEGRADALKRVTDDALDTIDRARKARAAVAAAARAGGLHDDDGHRRD